MYPILLDLGFFQLRSYGMLVALALVAGLWLAQREALRRGMSASAVSDGAMLIVVAGLAGARLYYVAFNQPAEYLVHPLELIAIWHGGLSIHGALLGGLLATVWHVRRRGIPFWRFADVVAPGLALAQTIGQLACFLNGDSYGRPTSVPWAVTFTDSRAPAPLGVPLHPVQLYELAAYLVVFLVTWRVARRPLKDGTVILTYAVAYGVARFAVELFRGDPPTIAGIVVPQAASALLVATALVVWWIRRSAPPLESRA